MKALSVKKNTNNKILQDSTLELKLKCNSRNQTIVAHQYETHPMRTSQPFRLDSNDNNRAYIYLRNNSPGLFGEDELNIALSLAEDTRLYLTEQSAAKVHPMKEGVTAKVNYQWYLERESMVEFVPEPIILYAESALEQTTRINIHPTASLFWSDLVLPGRLARGESYQFRYYDHCLEIHSDCGELWCKERMYLKGKDNPFSHNPLFASLPILGNAIAIMPKIEANVLKDTLDNIDRENNSNLVTAISVLPQDKGVSIKALASKTQSIKDYWNLVLDILRELNQQPTLPHVPK